MPKTPLKAIKKYRNLREEVKSRGLRSLSKEDRHFFKNFWSIYPLA